MPRTQDENSMHSVSFRPSALVAADRLVIPESKDSPKELNFNSSQRKPDPRETSSSNNQSMDVDVEP